MFTSKWMGIATLVAIAAIPVTEVHAQGYALTSKAPASAFSAALKPDIIGINPMMTGAEVQPIIDKHFVGRDKPMASNLLFPNTNVAFISSIVGGSFSGRPYEKVRTLFSSPASNNKLWFMTRTLDYGTENLPSREATVSSILQKYGSPTLADSKQLVYVYKGNQVLAGATTYNTASAMESMSGYNYERMQKQIAPLEGPTREISECRNMAAKEWTVQVDLPNHFNRYQQVKCEGILTIRLGYTDQDPSRINSMDIMLIDHKASLSAALIDDAAVKASQEYKVRNAPTGATPKL